MTRNQSYDASTGRYTYDKTASATGAGGTQVSSQREATTGAGGAGVERQTTVSNPNTGATATTDAARGANTQGAAAGRQTTYTNPTTGQTQTHSSGAARQGDDLYADHDGNVYRNSGSGGWQKQTTSGWQSASGDTSWANREQQARSDGDSRFSSFSRAARATSAAGGGALVEVVASGDFAGNARAGCPASAESTRLGTRMVSGAAFADSLERHGFDFFAGVPCSLIEDLIAVLQGHPRLPYVAAVREDVAVGLAAGAWLGGKRPAVLMQNSGLGTSLNALASLALMYGLPSLLIVTWRGHGGQDAPEHILMGAISPPLLDLLGIPHRVASAGSLEADLAWAVAEMDARMHPVALLVPPGVVETGRAHGAAPAVPLPEPAPMPWEPRPPLEPATISRLAALGAAVKQLGDEPLIHANGYICRESFSLGDRPQNFYMIGSMGLAPAIGLGLALARPRAPVVVADGDGNLLMNLGILAQVGALRPTNFVHCAFDNEVYGSTGNQRSSSRAVRLDRLADAAGYRTVAGVTGVDQIAAALRSALASPGPHFVLVKVTPEEAAVPRIPYAPEEIRDRFRREPRREVGPRASVGLLNDLAADLLDASTLNRMPVSCCFSGAGPHPRCPDRCR